MSRVRGALAVGEAAALSLKLQGVRPAVPDDDHVRDAGHDAERLEDRGLGGRPVSAVGRMKCKDAGHAALAQMQKDRALNLLFGPLATRAGGGDHRQDGLWGGV
jgi:hypothetical protein